MAVVVVGGHSRNIGKTSVAAGVIAAFPELGWTAVKITQFGHGICSMSGHACGCAVDEHAYSITEERDREGRGDTCRFLRAGARRSLWVRTKQGQLGLAMPALRPRIEASPQVVIESNSVLGFLEPDLYLVVLKPDVGDFKPSARVYLGRADAAVLVASGTAGAQWSGVPEDLVARLRVFRCAPPEYVSEELKGWLAARLGIRNA